MTAWSTILDLLHPGMRVFVPGSAGEPTELLNLLAEDPDRVRGVEFVTSSVPGINSFDWERLACSASVTGLFSRFHKASTERAGRLHHLPITYAGFVETIANGPRAFDLVLTQLALPSASGRCSMGPAVEFLPALLARGTPVAAVLNPCVPDIASAPSIEQSGLAAAVTAGLALPIYDPGPSDPVSATIAQHLAPFVHDRSIVQCGLGKVPTALLSHLGDRRGLSLHTGMYGEGVPALAASGALDPTAVHAACVAVGSLGLYDWFSDHPEFQFKGCEYTHDLARLVVMPRFVAINSAIEVDLFGQAALEHAGGVAVSGAGGAPDFARAGRLSAGGLSVVALPSMAREQTRIVPRLTEPGVATLARTDIDLIVTEHGVADFRGQSVQGRAETLIAIADPGKRSALSENWNKQIKQSRL